MRQLPVLLAIIIVTIILSSCGANVRAKPEFKLGFRELAEQVPTIIGEPLEDEHYGPNGDSLQRTTTGLMVWRKSDNWTAFTNGSRSWVNGPEGIQERANEERFAWEAPAPVAYPVKGKFLDLLVATYGEPYTPSATRMPSLAGLLEKELETPVRPIDRSGSSAVADLLGAQSDGYTLAYMALPELISGYLSPYGTASGRNEFLPVALESLEPMVLAVPKDSRFKSLQEVVDAARLNPERIRVRADSLLGRLAVDELGRLAGVEFAVVQGSADADLEVQLVSRLLPGAKGGKIRVLGVMDGKESPALGGVKTLRDQGYDLQIAQPWGYFVRAGTPPNIVETLSASLGSVMATEGYKKERQAKLTPWGHQIRYQDAVQTAVLWSDLEARLRLVDW